ncbi:MAG: exodeoxyribonuclease VII large subunit [Rhodocyclaceae bacterium]|nr:exodeoxyribonuclease VII large subunit [Rhodocyclaceae bacterium]
MTLPVLSVSELSGKLRRSIESSFPLLWVSGEVSNLVRAASGHIYFSLKDESAQMRCVMFRNRVQLVGWQLANGQQVEVNARITLFEARGDVQLSVDGMRRAGLGKLYEAFARLRQQLDTEGMFACERKRPLPLYPRRIGVITSPQAAAFHDVIAALRRRAPHVSIVLYPTRVQGAEAAPGIVEALHSANRAGNCDVLLLVRGGGSIEDLWPFNEESTARAIGTSAIPVVSGVGHETDLTISDLVADQRAATPTAAAELVSAHWFAAAHTLERVRHRLRESMNRRLREASLHVDGLAAQLIHPATRIARSLEQAGWLASRLHAAMHRQLTLADFRIRSGQTRWQARRPDLRLYRDEQTRLTHRLHHAMQAQLSEHQHALSHAEQAIAHLAPERTLARGYAIVRNHQGAVVLDPTQLTSHAAFSIQLAHGSISAHPILPDALIAGSHKPD